MAMNMTVQVSPGGGYRVLTTYTTVLQQDHVYIRTMIKTRELSYNR